MQIAIECNLIECSTLLYKMYWISFCKWITCEIHILQTEHSWHFAYSHTETLWNENVQSEERLQVQSGKQVQKKSAKQRHLSLQSDAENRTTNPEFQENLANDKRVFFTSGSQQCYLRACHSDRYSIEFDAHKLCSTYSQDETIS